MLEVAATCDPNTVRDTIRKVRDTLDPDAGLAAYLRALERRDLTVTGVGEGFDVRGYLDPETGAKLKEVLYSLGKKTTVDDDRTAGQRRVDALGDLCRSVLDHGLPTDRGLRPHLFVTVATERLDISHPTASHRSVRLRCWTATARSPTRCWRNWPATARSPRSSPRPTGSHVLDVGRTSRLATLKQRQAILVQQDGVCFNPGCDRTHLEIHHMIAWSIGGRTDMADLRGYCTRCHHLIHLGLLIVTPDATAAGNTRPNTASSCPNTNDRATHLTRIYLQALTHGGKHHALQSHPGLPPRPRPHGDPDVGRAGVHKAEVHGGALHADHLLLGQLVPACPVRKVPNVRRTRTAIIACALTLATACTNTTDQPINGPTSSTPTTPTTPTASDPTAPQPPELPTAAQHPTTAGAKAFVTYYIDVLNYRLRRQRRRST